MHRAGRLALRVQPAERQRLLGSALEHGRHRLQLVQARRVPLHPRGRPVRAGVDDHAGRVVGLVFLRPPGGLEAPPAADHVQAHHVFTLAARRGQLVLLPLGAGAEADPTVAAGHRVVDAQVEIVVRLLPFRGDHPEDDLVWPAHELLLGQGKVVPPHERAQRLAVHEHRHAGFRGHAVGLPVDENLQRLVQAVGRRGVVPRVITHAEVGREPHLGGRVPELLRHAATVQHLLGLVIRPALVRHAHAPPAPVARVVAHRVDLVGDLLGRRRSGGDGRTPCHRDGAGQQGDNGGSYAHGTRFLGILVSVRRSMMPLLCSARAAMGRNHRS